LLFGLAHRGLAAAAERNGAPLVRVFVAGPPEAVLRTRATVRELLARLHVDAIVEAADGESALAAAHPDAAARAFLDFRSQGAPRVVVVQRSPERELERRTLPGSTSLEVSVEEAAHVLYMAVESSLSAGEPSPSPAGATSSSDGPAGASSAATAENAPEPAAPASAAPATSPAPAASAATKTTPTASGPARVEVAAEPVEPADTTKRDAGSPSRGRPLEVEGGLSVFGAVTSFEVEHPLPGVGVMLDGALGDGAFRPAASLSGGVFFPSPVSGAGQSNSLRAESLRLDVLAEWRPWSRIRIAAGGGGGVDRVSFDAGPSTTAVLSAGTETRVDPVLDAVVGLRFRITRGLGAFALASVDFDLTPHRYLREADGDVTIVFALPRARPAGFLGLTYVFHDATPAVETERGAQ
jgi:hypothetical protein